MTPILLSTPLSSLSSILFSTPRFSIKQRLASTPAAMLKEERKKAILKFTHPEEGWNLLYTFCRWNTYEEGGRTINCLCEKKDADRGCRYRAGIKVSMDDAPRRCNKFARSNFLCLERGGEGRTLAFPLSMSMSSGGYSADIYGPRNCRLKR